MDLKWFEAIFLSRKPLAKVIPNLDRLLANPHKVLSRGDIEIPAMKPFRIAILMVFLLPIVHFLITKHWNWLWATAGLAIALTFLLIVVLVNPYRLVLSRDGVEFFFRRKSVWCPWRFFSASGNPFTEFGKTTLPIEVDSLSEVELRDDGLCVADGRDVKIASFKVNRRNKTVTIASELKAPLKEIGNLLLDLGERLGSEDWEEPEKPTKDVKAPKQKQIEFDDESRDALTSESLPKLKGGVLTMSLTQAAFPPICCGCGEPTGEVLDFLVRSRGSSAITLLTLGRIVPAHVALPIPYCSQCFDEQSRPSRWVNWLVIPGATILGGVFGYLVALNERTNEKVPFSGAGAFLGFIIGAFVSGIVATKLFSPLKKSRYIEAEQLVTLVFRQDGYAERVVKASRRSRK